MLIKVAQFYLFASLALPLAVSMLLAQRNLLRPAVANFYSHCTNRIRRPQARLSMGLSSGDVEASSDTIDDLCGEASAEEDLFALYSSSRPSGSAVERGTVYFVSTPIGHLDDITVSRYMLVFGPKFQ